ncbi:TrbG/VirB9 family P-type conjugative transfer protein [Piscinibacter sp. HJYY11]|uniref:TrbG/VirB9 family P-type conjugative transfer protein n=1 Tax=Piscinibacter sp. HJYY11 TaxID=2801333 RepID=UPI00191F108A|nr:TrbG/VirB9 family P-type conjugative transfer protein [Piscinibacter sp. HJYY11]MBL0726120.1 TrbG/VirB9 family P-type conjugative transfer protein [Piscinibacter sp. HJYY11]
MKHQFCIGVAVLVAGGSSICSAAPPDPRLREIAYDPHAVVSVPVQRGVVTLIVLDADEAIQEMATGLGAECSKPDAVWCIAAQPGGRTLFVKPKGQATTSNTLAVVTNQRQHAFRLDLVTDGGGRPAVYRLRVKAPQVTASLGSPQLAQAPSPVMGPETESASENNSRPEQPTRDALVAARLRFKPLVVNSDYTLAEGRHSTAIVPTLVFDDGRFTYFRFPGNLELPAVFHVLADGTETLVNSRMEDDLLVVDRVSHRLMLRSSNSVVGIWNESFDPEGAAPQGGTTVPGVTRSTSASPTRGPTSGERP